MAKYYPHYRARNGKVFRLHEPETPTSTSSATLLRDKGTAPLPSPRIPARIARYWERHPGGFKVNYDQNVETIAVGYGLPTPAVCPRTLHFATTR